MKDFQIFINDLDSILFTKEQLDDMINRLGREITSHYQDRTKERKLILIGILKGSFIFISDLARKIPLPLELMFTRASSYGSGTTTSGSVHLEALPEPESLKGADVLLIEDILDSGNTLSKISAYFQNSGAASVQICTLLDKKARRTAPVQAKFVGSDIEDEFVVGYGLDYNERYRNLPFIGILKREIYS